MNILCNLLINSNIETDTVAKVRGIKKDVWEYYVSDLPWFAVG